MPGNRPHYGRWPQHDFTSLKKLRPQSVTSRITDSREDRRAKKISLTSEGMFFIQRLTLAQSMYLKEIWDYLTHDEQELFEVINKKLLAHFSDASS